MRPSLVVGASGLVGEHLLNRLPAFGTPPVATYFTKPIPTAEKLDVRDPAQVDSLFDRHEPGLVFLPAALTNVDLCETDRPSSYAINVGGARNIVKAANRVGARLIYFSTDYIFDGTSGPYQEDSAANPISEYGRQKLIAEHSIALTALNYLIIRTTVVYGWERQGKNFVFRLLKSLEQGTRVRVPFDQMGTPTYAPELAESAIKLAFVEFAGVVNVAGSNTISRYDFAVQAARSFGLPEQLIHPVSTEALRQAAPRPLLGGLRTELLNTLLGQACSTSMEGLRQMFNERNRDGIHACEPS